MLRAVRRTEPAKVFYDEVLKGGYGFAIDATVTLDEKTYGHKNTTAKSVVRNRRRHRQGNQGRLLPAAGKFWVNWVAYDDTGAFFTLFLNHLLTLR